MRIEVWLWFAACAACGRTGFNSVDADAAANAGSGANIAFVTSTLHTPDEIGSDLSGGDQICMEHAAAAGLAGTYVAFVSSSTVAARDRISTARGWVRTDGSPFLDRVEDLDIGRIYQPLELDELGEVVGNINGVITNTKNDGTPGNVDDCNDYTTMTGSVDVGSPTATSGGWVATTSILCNQTDRLYCFGIDRQTKLSFTPATGRRAFLSSSIYTPDATGLAKADAQCATDAALGGVTGTFQALLPTTTASAISRFSLTGATWVRLDGIALATSPLLFANGELTAPLNLTTAGIYSSAGYSVFGGANDLQHASPDATRDCSDWTDPAGNAEGATPYVIDAGFFTGPGSGCGPMSIYCLEP